MPDELKTLCQTPLKIKIGEKDFEVHPLNFIKIEKLREPLKEIYDKADSIQKQVEKKKTAIEEPDWDLIDSFRNLYDIFKFDSVFVITSILLKRFGDEAEYPLSKEDAKKYLDVAIFNRILQFIAETASVDEAVKNVIILKGLLR